MLPGVSRLLLELEGSVSIALVPRTIYHPPLQQSYFFLLGFLICEDLVVCFGIITHNQIFDSKYCFVLNYSPKKSIATTRNCRLFAGCSALGLFGVMYTVTCRCVCTYFWGCHKWSCRGMISVKWGERMVTRG